ncbi:hypothetical protein C2G38_2049364 [Gigaspora rosea]|uniref:Uncharacterized protein n=1 Tax=Gigaspora rosea TaxID=44941 RepID=A0A397U2D5_9GLOM|nr:hypothetical protein C2G38_2049364 [Gigaspora rosea]
MGIYRSNKRRYQARQAAQKSLEKRQAVSYNKIITEIEALLLGLNQEQLDDIYKILTKLMNNKTISNDISHDNETVSNNISHDNEISKEDYQKTKLISLVQQLSNKEIHAANHLFTTMRYSKGSDKGKLLLPYLQKRAYNYITDGLYKSQSSNETLQNANNRLALENKKLICQNKKLIGKTQSLGHKKKFYIIKNYITFQRFVLWFEIHKR